MTTLTTMASYLCRLSLVCRICHVRSISHVFFKAYNVVMLVETIFFLGPNHTTCASVHCKQYDYVLCSCDTIRRTPQMSTHHKALVALNVRRRIHSTLMWTLIRIFKNVRKKGQRPSDGFNQVSIWSAITFTKRAISLNRSRCTKGSRDKKSVLK